MSRPVLSPIHKNITTYFVRVLQCMLLDASHYVVRVVRSTVVVFYYFEVLLYSTTLKLYYLPVTRLLGPLGSTSSTQHHHSSQS